MNPKVIKTKKEYNAALEHIGGLLSARPGTLEGNELELWTLLIRQYEEQCHPIEPPDPISAIAFRMEQQGLKKTDLAPYIGSRSKISEVLGGKRPLSLAMIRKLHNGLGIPAEVLLQVTQTAPGSGLAWPAPSLSPPSSRPRSSPASNTGTHPKHG